MKYIQPKGKYILAFKAKRKNAKRHIAGRFNTLADARKSYLITNDNYDYFIYDSKWNLIEEVQSYV